MIIQDGEFFYPTADLSMTASVQGCQSLLAEQGLDKMNFSTHAVMKKLFVCLGLWTATCLHAQGDWFNLMGDPADETVNTIEVDPTPVSVKGESKVMRIRVSRSEDRVDWEGVSYRSYASKVLVDCTSHTARYRVIKFYSQPAWKGEPHKRAVYPESELRPVEFRDVEPNPYERIIRAACDTAKISNN